MFHKGWRVEKSNTRPLVCHIGNEKVLKDVFVQVTKADISTAIVIMKKWYSDDKNGTLLNDDTPHRKLWSDPSGKAS